MAITFRKPVKGITNYWTQLKDLVSNKSLYDIDTYEGLNDAQRQNYLLTLYHANDQLATRLPSIYNDRDADAQVKYSLLMNEYNYIQQENVNESEISGAIDKQLNEKLSKKNQNTWSDWLVANKYEGDYAKFATEYTGENAKGYKDALLEMIPAEYEFSEDLFQKGISAINMERDQLLKEYRASIKDDYDKVIKNAAEQIKENRQRRAYEASSKFTRFANTLWQMPLSWAGEVVEMVEGVGDVLLTIAGGVGSAFGADVSGIKNAIKYDWWAPTDWMLAAVPESYLSKYADDNIMKSIHEIGISVTDIGISIGLNAVTGGVGGTAVYYTSMFGKNVESEMQQGYGFGEAFNYAVGSTIIEMATEKISGSKFFGGGFSKGWEKFAAKSFGRKLVHDMIGEGLEEGIAEIGSGIWHGIVTGDTDLGTAEGWSNVGKSVLIGGIVGGIIAGGDAAVTRSIIGRTAVTVKNATGSVKVSPYKAALVNDFVRRTGEKIESGKTVSKRTQARFDALKDIKIVNSDIDVQIVKALFKSLKTGKPVDLEEVQAKEVEIAASEDYYEKTVLPKLKRKLHLKDVVSEKLFAKTKDNTKTKTDKTSDDLAEEAKKLADAANVSPDNSTMEFTETADKKNLAAIIHDALDADSKAQNMKDWQATGVITLAELMSMYGEDSVMQGVKLFAQYQEKTIDEIIGSLQIGTDSSDYVEVKGDTSVLQKHFAGAQFKLVKTKEFTELDDKYDNLCSALTAVRQTIKSKQNAAKDARLPIKLFITDTATVSTSFFVDDTLYVSASWLESTDINRLKDIIISKYCVEDARRLLTSASDQKASDLLVDAISRIENPTRSINIMLQEIAYIMFYQRDNIMLKQLLSYGDESNIKAVYTYFDNLRKNFANRYIQNASSVVLLNMVNACEQVFDTGDEPKVDKTLPEDRTESVAEMIDGYRNHRFRSFSFTRGTKGLPSTAAKVNAMYLYMKNTYGFNKELDLSKKINWLKVLLDPDNYDGDGFTRLANDINKYEKVHSTTGYDYFGTTKKTKAELLNYHLDNICGLMVFSNGTIAQQEFITEILNTDAIEAKVSSYIKANSAGREPVGKVADFITKHGTSLLPKYAKDINIYLDFDSSDLGDTASIYGTPQTGMWISINMAAVKARSSNKPVTVGGSRLILDENGELRKDDNGRYIVDSHIKTISSEASKVVHEIGHYIGMALKFTGTFGVDDIAKTYSRVFNKLTVEPRRKLIEDLRDFLSNSDIAKPFAKCINDQVDHNDNAAVTSTINKFLNNLDMAVTKGKTTPSTFAGLAKYLYFTGYAHEMFANGEPQAVASKDTIGSKIVSTDSDRSDTVIVTKSDRIFIQILNGETVSSSDPIAIETKLQNIQDSPENAVRRIFAESKSVADLKKNLKVELVTDLLSPTVWEDETGAKIGKSKLLESIEDNFDVKYDPIKQDFVSVSHRIADPYTINNNDDYAAIVTQNGTIVNAAYTAFYTKEMPKAFVLHNKGNKRDVLYLNEKVDLHKNDDDTVSLGNLQFKNKAIVIADGKVFNNIAAANKYLNTALRNSKNSQFNDFFYNIICKTATRGRQQVYRADTIYMTPDGNIYCRDVTTPDWKLNVPENTVGSYETDNPEGIPYGLTDCFNDCGIVRFYREGGSWTAFGTPNRLQDNFIKELRAERASLVSYNPVNENPNVKLYVDKHTGKTVIGSADSDMTEVRWRNHKWYPVITRILETYGITKFSQLERLGFSDEFIETLRTKLTVPDSVFLQYLRDANNTEFSKRILTDNGPTSGSHSWHNNPHIHNIAEAEQYFKLAATYSNLMPENKIFNNILELAEYMEKIKTPKNIGLMNAGVERINNLTQDTSNDIYIQLLNKDASTGLGLDAKSFNTALGYLTTHAKHTIAREGISEENIEAEDDEGHTVFKGESLDTPEEYDELLEKLSGEDEIMGGFLDTITQIGLESDTEVRNKKYKDLLTRLSFDDLAEYEYKDLLRNKIMNKLEGVDLAPARRTELEKAYKRVEKYKLLKGTEKLAEFKKLTKEYMRLRQTRSEYIQKGGEDYYKRLLETVGEVGSFIPNMAQRYNKFKEAYANLQQADPERAEALAKQFEAYSEVYSELLNIDWEYPGLQEHFEAFTSLFGSMTNPKHFNMRVSDQRAIAVDTINFIKQYQEASKFRQGLASEEGVDFYYKAKRAKKGAKPYQSDLQYFDDIPENVKPIGEFDAVAREAYDRITNDFNVLSNILNDPQLAFETAKLFGTDFVFNLKKEYNIQNNPLPEPSKSSGKRDLFENLLTKAGMKTEDIQKVVENVKAKKPDREITNQDIVNAIKKENYSSYKKFIADKLAAITDFLREGTSVTDQERQQALAKVANKIEKYKWRKTVPQQVVTIHLNKLAGIKRSPEVPQTRIEAPVDTGYLANLKSEAVTVNERITSIQENLNNISNLLPEYETAANNVKAIKDKLEPVNAELSKKTEALNAVTNEYSAILSEIESYGGRDVSAAEYEKIKKLHAKKKELQEKLKEAQDAVGLAKQEVNKVTAELSAAETSVHGLKSKLDDLRYSETVKYTDDAGRQQKKIETYGIEYTKQRLEEMLNKYKEELKELENKITKGEEAEARRKTESKTSFDYKAAEAKMKEIDRFNTEYKGRVIERIKNSHSIKYSGLPIYAINATDDSIEIISGNITGLAAPKKRETLLKNVKGLFDSEDAKNAITEETRKVSREVEFSSISRRKRYRIGEALASAYYYFMSAPKTDRTITKFEDDTDIALDSGKINIRVPDRTKRELVTIDVPKEYAEPIEDGGKPYTKEMFDEKIRHILNKDITISEDEQQKGLDEFRNRAYSESDEFDEMIEESKTPREKLEDKLKRLKKYRKALADATVVRRSEYKIFFDLDTGTFRDSDGNELSSDLIDITRLPWFEADKLRLYLADNNTWDFADGIPTSIDLVHDDGLVHYDAKGKSRVIFSAAYVEALRRNNRPDATFDFDTGKLSTDQAIELSDARLPKFEADKYKLWQIYHNLAFRHMEKYTIGDDGSIMQYNVPAIYSPSSLHIARGPNGYPKNEPIIEKHMGKKRPVEIKNPDYDPNYDATQDPENAKMLERNKQITDTTDEIKDHIDTDKLEQYKKLGFKFKEVFSADYVNQLRSKKAESIEFEDSSKSSSLDDILADLDNIVKGPTAKPPKPVRLSNEYGSGQTVDLKSGLSENTQDLLDYKPDKWDDKQAFSTKDFLEQKAVQFAKFTNEKDMLAFVEKIESNPSVPINSPQEAIIFAMLNKITTIGSLTNEDLKTRATNLVMSLAARAGRTLGMAKTVGVTPVDQLIAVCSSLLKLTDDEKQHLKTASDVQAKAIGRNNYKLASESMEFVFKLLKKHQSELPVSYNIFATGLTPEERTIRWHNIAERVTTWKYFAMLGSPTTFFTKNIASNVILTGMNKAAEGVANIISKFDKTLESNYTLGETEFIPLVKEGNTLQLLSESDVRAIVTKTMTSADAKKVNAHELTQKLNGYIKTQFKIRGEMPTFDKVAVQANKYLSSKFYQYRIDKAADDSTIKTVHELLEESGLLDAIMNDQVSKYDRGYDVKIGKLRKLVLNEETSLDDLSETNAAVLADALRKDEPFKSKFMNNWYKLIFNTMEKGDKKFIRPKIIKTVQKLVASNMTADEIQALKNGDKDAKAKFNDFVQYAVDDAMKTYLRSNSELQTKVMKLFHNHPVAQLIFTSILPFPRMVINTMSTALSYSPVGFLKALHLQMTESSKFTKLQVQKELGKATVGTVAIAFGAILAAIGWLSLDDDDEFGGVQLVIANKFRIALSDLEPAMLPFTIGATMVDAKTEGIWNHVLAGGNTLLNATLLGEALEVFGNKDGSGFIVDTFSNFVNQFIPSMFRHVARTIDPTKKQYSSNKGIKIFQRIASALPFVSLLVPSKINNYTGDAVYQNVDNRGWASVLAFINAMAPAKFSIDIEDAVERETKAVGANTSGPSKRYTIDGQEYILPERTYEDYKILRAKLYNQYAKEVINTAAYKALSINAKRAKLKTLQDKATNEARKQLNIR